MATTRTSGLNRKQRRELARRLQATDPGLEVMHPNPIATPILYGALTASPPISIGSPIGYSSVE
jgi:hypothetical protein